MGKRSNRKNAASVAISAMEDAFSGNANTISWRYDAFMANPDDIEALHKLRVSLRTARSLAAFSRPWVKAKRLEALDEAMRKVVRKTSLLRELDVLAEKVRSDFPDDEALNRLCASAAHEERLRASAALASDKAQARLTFAIDELHDIAWKKSAKSSLDEKAVRNRFRELVREVKDAIERLDYHDYGQVHDARKNVKLVRYAAEQFGELIGDEAAAAASAMKAEQDRLGAVCDAHADLALIERLRAYPGASTAAPGLDALASECKKLIDQA